MKLKNELFKLLRKEGEKLPQEFYEARHKYPQYIVQENIDVAMKTNGGIVTEDDYSYPEQHLVNHGRRLKQAFKNGGMELVHQYLNKRK